MSFYQSEKMMLMHPGTDDVVKHRMLQAKMLSREARGERLNLGKKMSVPRDVMMEELNLPSNRGSRMFQERQKRLERFTLENTPDTAHFNTSAHLVSVPPPQITQQPRGGKENQAFSTPGKHSLVMNLQKTVSKKGSPDVLAPGYSGPLKEIPREKFNTTVIPRLYCSPWREALGRNEDLLEALNAQLAPLPQRYQPANYRSARPFGGGVASKRVIPVVGFEAVETQNLPGAAIDRMCQRPNFNRAPAGWGGHPCPESNDL
ncbi:myozenin-2-like isoform X3 [Nerophis ophidion]|uniref:myozenin-2-like isoform X3 n=1 Tax=Nerophis ophidion TaxID=159077 RepID=UPI002ADF5977|nr:myozenin-2-like isoform X3 [Nerophis ophidion]